MELKGKIINFLGDSITEGVGVTDRAENRFDNVLKKEYGLEAVHNYGIGGTRLAHQSKPSEKPRHDLCFCGRIRDLDPSADIIVVYGGVNDYIHGDAKFGSADDKTPLTFCGGVNYLMDNLPMLYPGAKAVFLTPAHCFYQGIPDSMPSVRAEKEGGERLPLIKYVEAVKDAGKAHNIPVFDMYNCLGLDPNEPEVFEKYTVDGLHFNDAGHHIIAKKIADFILSL